VEVEDKSGEAALVRLYFFLAQYNNRANGFARIPSSGQHYFDFVSGYYMTSKNLIIGYVDAIVPNYVK